VRPGVAIPQTFNTDGNRAVQRTAQWAGTQGRQRPRPFRAFASRCLHRLHRDAKGKTARRKRETASFLLSTGLRDGERHAVRRQREAYEVALPLGVRAQLAQREVPAAAAPAAAALAGRAADAERDRVEPHDLFEPVEMTCVA
jgi:DNA-directed RNA polymerase specialized sigma24 family protein